MSFGQNLQFLRKMRNKMTQEELADRMGVSRQTVSKWELDAAYPEMSKVLDLCQLFSCSMDQLIREDMNVIDEAYSDIREEWMEPFRYLRYAVISREPEDDAKTHVRLWAEHLGIREPQIIGWDFPVLSQEQINVYSMHGYAAALVLPEDMESPAGAEVLSQAAQEYAVITIRRPFDAPFRLIPGAYQILLRWLQTNVCAGSHSAAGIPCFEREYLQDGVECMDVYMAVTE